MIFPYFSYRNDHDMTMFDMGYPLPLGARVPCEVLVHGGGPEINSWLAKVDRWSAEYIFFSFQVPRNIHVYNNNNNNDKYIYIYMY